MSLTINLPPAMETEARGYRMLEGSTLEQMFLDYLKKEFERRRMTQQENVTARSVKRREVTPDPDLYCEIKCDLFADESADWENA